MAIFRWKTGERIANLRRAVMVKREDRTREEETYPDSFFGKVQMNAENGLLSYSFASAREAASTIGTPSTFSSIFNHTFLSYEYFFENRILKSLLEFN